MKVLLAIDDSKFSAHAIEFVIQGMRPDAAELCVLHVIEPLLIIPYDYMSTAQVKTLEAAQQAIRKRGQELVEQAERSLRNARFKIRTALKDGDAKSAILDYAAQWPADLVVLGSHGRKGLDRFLMGSVSDAVARHAPCSVLIVRIPASP